MDKRIIILVVIAAIVGLVFSPAIMDLMSPPFEVDTQTKGYEHNSYMGWVELQTHAGCAVRNEANFQAESYITSWDEGEKSQLIVVQSFEKLAAYAYGCRHYEYRVWLKNSEASGWYRATEYDSPTYARNTNLLIEWVKIDTYSFWINGPYVGGVKVEMWGEWFYCFNAGWHKLSQDEAYLKSGKGQISVVEEVVEEGDDVKFDVRTGFSGGEGWLIRIHNPSGNQVATIEVSDDFDGYKYWTVPTGSFNPSGNNEWRVELYNSLFEQHRDAFFTVDTKDKIPNTPTLSLSKENPDTNEDIIVYMTASQNANTLLPIKSFKVWIFYGGQGMGMPPTGSDNWIKDGVIINSITDNGDGSYSAEYEFKGHKADIGGSTVTVRVQAFDQPDANGRASNAGWVSTQVWRPDDSNKPLISSNIMWLIIIIIILFLGAVLVFMFLPVPIQLKLIISGILIMVAIYFIVTGV